MVVIDGVGRDSKADGALVIVALLRVEDDAGYILGHRPATAIDIWRAPAQRILERVGDIAATPVRVQVDASGRLAVIIHVVDDGDVAAIPHLATPRTCCRLSNLFGFQWNSSKVSTRCLVAISSLSACACGHTIALHRS